MGPCSEGLGVRLYRDNGKENGNYYNGDSIGIYNIDVYSFDVALVVWECGLREICRNHVNSFQRLLTLHSKPKERVIGGI